MNLATKMTVLLSPSGVAYADKVLSVFGSDLIQYLPLNETSGTDALDASGNSRDGTYSGVVLDDSTFVNGDPAGRWDGTADYCDIYSASMAGAFDPDAGTALIYSKVPAAATWADGATRRPLNVEADANNRVTIIKTTSAVNTLGFYYNAGGTSKNTILTVTSTAWFQAAITWDTTADEVRIYYNGAQQGAALTGLGTWVGALASDSCNVGARNTLGGNSWNGWLAHMALGKRALTPTEIATLWNALPS